MKNVLQSEYTLKTPIYRFASLPSTQDKAFEVLESGEVRCAVVADEQTSGRGRQGREWISSRGRSLTLSYGFSKDSARIEGLSLVVGLSLLRVIDIADLRLKWPNDLILENAKVAGILVEARSQGSRFDIVVGVGINLENVGNYKGLGKQVDASDLVDRMEQDIDLFFEEGFEFFKADYEKHLWRKGQAVETTIRGMKRKVLISGINHNGSLTVSFDGRLETILSGELFL